MPGSQTSLNIRVTNATVGVASAQCIAENRGRFGIIFHNPSAAASIAITPTSFGAAALNTAGSFMLPPLTTLYLTEVQSVDAFNAIASAGATPLTIWEF